LLLYCRYHNFITEEEADHIINLVSNCWFGHGYQPVHVSQPSAIPLVSFAAGSAAEAAAEAAAAAAAATVEHLKVLDLPCCAGYAGQATHEEE
jgi:hypothetical protein